MFLVPFVFSFWKILTKKGEVNPGCLGYIGDEKNYPVDMWGSIMFIKPWNFQIPIKQLKYWALHGKYEFFFVAHLVAHGS